MLDETRDQQPSGNADNMDADIDASYLISDKAGDDTAKLIGEIRVNPREQPRLSLGEFTAANPPSGFSVEISPDPDPADAIVTQITNIGTAERYELTLHIANYGDKMVVAKVWQL